MATTSPPIAVLSAYSYHTKVIKLKRLEMGLVTVLEAFWLRSGVGMAGKFGTNCQAGFRKAPREPKVGGMVETICDGET